MLLLYSTILRTRRSLVVVCFICAAQPAIAGPLEDETAELLARLPDAPEDEQEQIIRRFGEIGPEARSAIPILIKRLDAAGFGPVPDALAHMHGEAIPFIVEQIENGLLEYSDGLWSYLAALEYDAGPLLSYAVGEIKSDDENVRAKAADWLGRSPHWPDIVIPALLQALRDESRSVRRNAAVSLGNFDRQPDLAIPVLIRAAEADPSPYVRKAALRALTELDPAGDAIIPVLVAALDDDAVEEGFAPFGSDAVSTVAIQQLNHVARFAEGAVPAVIARLNSDHVWGDVYEFRDLTGLLAYHPEESRAALPFLREQMERELVPDGAGIKVQNAFAGPGTFFESMMVRVSAAAVVAAIEPENERALATLIDAIEDERWASRSRGSSSGFFGPTPEPRTIAADALGILGPRAAAAIPALKRILETRGKNEEFLLPARAAWAMARIDPTDTACLEVLADNVDMPQSWDSPFYREDVDSIADVLGDRLSELVPATVRQAGAYNYHERAFYIDLVTRAGDDAICQLLEYWFQTFTDEERKPWSSDARRIIADLGPRAEPALELLLKSLHSPNHHVRAEAAWLLGRIDGHDEQIAAALLVDVLDDPRVVVRARAAESLAEIGPAAAIAEEGLRERLMDDSPWVRRAADAALWRILDE